MMIRQPISNQRKLVMGAISIILVAGSYSLLSYRQHLINSADTTIPSFLEMGKEFWRVCTEDNRGRSIFDDFREGKGGLTEKLEILNSIQLWIDIKATFIRYFIGLGAAACCAIVVGILMGCFESFAAFNLPLVSVAAYVPPTAMLAVFMVVLGIDFSLYIGMIVFGVYPVLTQAIYQAAKFDVHDESVYKAYTLGASNSELICGVVFPQIKPKIYEAIRLQLGPAMVYLIAAEMLLADVGFGHALRINGRIFNLALVYDLLAILALIGFGLDKLLTWRRKKSCPWFDKEEAE